MLTAVSFVCVFRRREVFQSLHKCLDEPANSMNHANEAWLRRLQDVVVINKV